MPGSARIDPRLQWLGLWFMWLVAFSNFFVVFEPAPHEFLALVAIGVAFLVGMAIPRPIILIPLALLIIYVAGGFIGVMIAPDFDEAVFQLSVTAFLAGTSLLWACFVYRDTVSRMALVINALQWGAIIATLLGVMGYFNVAGTGELFTINSRARGSFQDPNVFGPFVAGGVVFAIYAVLSRPMSQWLFPMIVILVGTLGILLSFSRGAWGFIAYCAVVMTILHFVLTNNAADRLRIIALSIAGLAVIAIAVLVALSVPAISDLFTIRAQLVQSYDAGELGRFGRIIRGFAIAPEHPLGLGAFGFKAIYGYDPHNVYLNALMAHGWMGFFAYTGLVFITAFHLLKVVLYNPTYRSVAVPLLTIFTGLMLVGTFIDTDRWRQFFMILGLSWGVIGASIANPYKTRQQRTTAQSRTA